MARVVVTNWLHWLDDEMQWRGKRALTLLCAERYGDDTSPIPAVAMTLDS